jgi:hypothetical protein
MRVELCCVHLVFPLITDFVWGVGRDENELQMLFLELCGTIRDVWGCSDGVWGVQTHWE